MFPSVFNIESFIASIFSSGIASNVVLFIVCIAFMYQISPVGILFVIIFIVSPSTPAEPISPGVSISLFPVGEFFDTLICISFCFIVFGIMVIIPALLTLPSLLGITFGFTCFSLILLLVLQYFR